MSTIDKSFNIISIFKDDDIEQQNDGCWKLECPSCGLQGGRTKGFILFPDSNRAFCHSSQKNFNILEAYALKQGIIQCKDGRDTGEKGNILKGSLFVQTCDHFRNNYGDEEFNKVAEILNLKEEIELPGLISKFASIIGKKLGPKNILFYRQELREVYEIGKIKKNDKTVTYNGFIPISPSRFVTLTENYFNPWKKLYTKKGESIVYESMPQNKAKIVLDSDQFRNELPIIDRILGTTIPINHDGELTFPLKGYDNRFRSWLPFNAPTITEPNMTIEEAVKYLRWLYSDFCFKDEKNDMSKAIAALLTPFLKGLFTKFSVRTPIFCYTANRERSGKDYCAGVTGILYEGYALEDAPFSDGEKSSLGKNDELKKKLLAVLMQGRQRYHSSNNKGILNSAVLESISTAERFSERELGTNKTHALDNELYFSLSGNAGMTFTSDLMNRSVFIELFLDIEDANAREFKNTPNLHSHVMNNRSKILSALYALVRNWYSMGKPKGSVPFASFPEWATICGGIMESAGFVNPCLRNKSNVVTDTEITDIKKLFELCYNKYPNTKILKSDIKKIIEEHNYDENNEQIFVNVDWNSRSDVIKFWAYLNKYTDRILSNIKLKIITNKHSTRFLYIFIGMNDGENGKVIVYNKKTENTIKNKTHIENNEKIEENISIKNIKNQDKPKVGSDRKVQFYDENCYDTKNIVTNITKEEVEQFIKENNGVETKKLLDLGVGSFKFLNELIEENKVKEEDYKLWALGQTNHV